MIIGLLLILAGFCLSRLSNQIETQRRKELFSRWDLERKMMEEALMQIDSLRKRSIGTLEIIAEKIRRVEDRKESVLRDFKRMLYN